MCADDGITTSTCLTGKNGPCEPTYSSTKKGLFLGGTLNDTDFYLELAFQTFGSACQFDITWASSRPVNQVHVFAMAHQFGTMGGADDPEASCFEGVRYKVVDGANKNYNIVSNSLQYDSRFSLRGVPGLLYGAGNVQNPPADLFFGQSSTSANFRDASRKCPAGVTGDSLPVSFKVVIDGGGIPSAGLNNYLDVDSGAPNVQNVGNHYIMVPDRGLCIGKIAQEAFNNGSYVMNNAAGCSTGEGCYTNQGPPVFASPPSEFKRDTLTASMPSAPAYQGPWTGADFSTP